MILDRLETLSALAFIAAAIPKDAKTGKNCLFVRVEDNRLILIGGAQFVTKKVVLESLNTVEESARTKKTSPLPKTFMIPRADLFAFMEMMKEHKAQCKLLAKNDPSYLSIEITGKELISYDGRIVYDQPKFEFKDLETCFQITEEPVSGIPLISADLIVAMTGFSKSNIVQTTFTGTKNPIHFQQGDYEAVVLPPVEKEKKGKEEDIGDGQTTTYQEL